MSRYQKGKTKLDFTEARDSEWQWHQLSHMQVCTSLQTENHASTPPLKFFTGRMPFLPPNQQRQSTEGIMCRVKGQKFIGSWFKNTLRSITCQQVIYFCTCFCLCELFSVSICVLCFFLLWAASYDGLMLSLAACHCNN